MPPKPLSSMVSWCYQAMRTTPSGHWAAASQAEQADVGRYWLTPCIPLHIPSNSSRSSQKFTSTQDMQWGQQKRTSKTQIQSSKGCLHNFSTSHTQKSVTISSKLIFFIILVFPFINLPFSSKSGDNHICNDFFLSSPTHKGFY